VICDYFDKRLKGHTLQYSIKKKKSRIVHFDLMVTILINKMLKIFVRKGSFSA